MDWADLWRPELGGKIGMVDSPREVIGAVLKYLGASYNTSDIDSQVNGGRNAVKIELATFTKQVRLFDSANYCQMLLLLFQVQELAYGLIYGQYRQLQMWVKKNSEGGLEGHLHLSMSGSSG